MKASEVLLLLSGGIDSTTLLAELVKKGLQVHALSFDYGQRHRIELEYAQRNASQHKVKVHRFLKLDYENMAQGNIITGRENGDTGIIPNNRSNNSYVPGRNLLMLSHAAAYSEAHGIKEIYFAANGDDGQRFPDCTSSFLDAFNLLLRSSTNAIQIHAPYLKLSKADVIRRSIWLDVNLQHTLSCYNPVGHSECGSCISCILKSQALEEVNTEDKFSRQVVSQEPK